jgi:Sec-independent protein secretion pathway component TatC
MSVKNGIYRVAQFIKWTSRTLGGLFILIVLFTPKDSTSMIILLALTVVFMAIAEGIAWVIEGFSRN